ncbi:MAG: PKD domain-containing protein, partial [Deltaproteobacteria bacterium]|nr:PKD domain-containing protein [Deltaproteobacteria bacterium]
VWRSTDNGATWSQVTPRAGWSARWHHKSVAMADGSIVLMGGLDDQSSYKNDVWRSTDNGATWTQQTASAGWSPRYDHSSVAMPDGSIVLMGGFDNNGLSGLTNDVWRLPPAATPQTGSISISSDPLGATIYLDNVNQGVTPKSLEKIPFGVHVVKLTLDGYEDWSGNVELTAASPSASINPKLSPVPPTPPVANFIATPTFGKAPLHVQFTDLSANGPLAWAWSFGDGGTSTERNPLHQFTKEGKYAVSLKVSNAFGSSKETKKGYIIVTSSVPVADFTATPITGPAPLHVQFTDTSSNSPTSWQWNFGDGGTSIEQNPLYTYLSTGTYTVSLKATNAFGSDTVKKAKYVKVTRPEVCDATGPYIDFVINNVNYGPECTPGAWQSAVCYDNAVIRWALAGESTPFHDILSNWMWKRNDNCPDSGHSFAVDQPYGKDIHIAGVKNTDIGWYHAVDAELRTGKDPANWNSWKFFNYDNLDIKKGDYQIPAGTSICRTKVWIRQIDSVFGCGAYDGQIGSTFYIDSKLKIQSSQDPNCPESPLLSKMGASFNENQKLPDSILKAVKSIGHETPFGISKWETDPTIKEMTIYAYDIQDENKINALSGIQIENYTIKIVKDKEFETTRADVQKQLLQLRKNPEYQIGGISMITDAFGEPPGNYAELWVYNSTPANKKLENTIIQGWEILVYPVSV